MTDQPQILLDPRAGSSLLKPYLQAMGAHVDDSQQIPADFAFVGNGPDGLIPIGGEYKLVSTGDIFTSMSDGRLTGTQLARMLPIYPRRYLLIEGPTRVAEDGTLEVSPKPGLWQRAQGRGDGGWQAHEYWSRLSSVAEFFSEPNVPGRTEVKETHNRRESAAWIISMWRYWNKPYAEHSSYRAWDRSAEGRQVSSGGFTLAQFAPTSELPIVQRMAACIDGIGEGHSGYVAKEFRAPAEMVLGKALYELLREDPAAQMAFVQDWRAVECLQRLKKPGANGQYRRIHFSKERVAKIRGQLWGT